MSVFTPFANFQTAAAGGNFPTGFTHNTTVDINAQDDQPNEAATDGTYLYIIGNRNDRIYRYNFDGTYTGTQWGVNPTSAGYAGFTYSSTTGNFYVYNNSLQDMFESDGSDLGSLTKIIDNVAATDPRDFTYVDTLGNFYVLDIGNDRIREMSIDGTFTGNFIDISSKSSNGRGLTWDGEKFWSTDITTDEAYAWDWDTKSYAGYTVDISANSEVGISLLYEPSVQKFYTVNYVNPKELVIYNATF